MENKNKEITQFLLDEEFLNYVFDESKGLTEYWNSFLLKNPKKNDAFREAKNILLHLDHPSENFSCEEVEMLKKRINISLKG